LTATVAREAERFLDHLTVERGLSANTLAAYKRDLTRYGSFLASRGIDDAADVDPATVRSFMAALSASTHHGDEPYSPTSVARSLSTVRSFHRFLLREGDAESDPAAGVVRPRLPRALPHPLSADEVQLILDAPDPGTDAGLRDRAWLEVLYGAGLRISEMTAMDVDDVDLDEGYVRVLGKGGKEREVPMGRYARDAMEAYLTRARPAMAAPSSRGALFLSQRGGRLRRQSCARLLSGYASKAGLTRKVSLHDLRHSFATHLLDGGADVRVVQELLGHASVATTQIYTLVTRDHLRSAYETAHPRAKKAT
jgi:integrase/recombinase XerD